MQQTQQTENKKPDSLPQSIGTSKTKLASQATYPKSKKRKFAEITQSEGEVAPISKLTKKFMKKTKDSHGS